MAPSQVGIHHQMLVRRGEKYKTKPIEGATANPGRTRGLGGIRPGIELCLCLIVENSDCRTRGWVASDQALSHACL